ncbi:Beta-glucan synthesis-associated protein KRE6 OS=Saccharomyces cerevisiae (strain ATCC 204508 / S288c) GN=KRE6 PE=1 SV=2 [Rhizoctonia solani AG-1 IB]|uniref:Beta-glucan synthesis-associated protein KRE6 n=1 Tax=Thanatephorus cucumeris (strain AG1-IB / isolate 7/3/14) TaxID=1108050 RepID=A0A0B7FYW3_THACB|nr:Beta-glucan synthesis-associated protein KRE6 OS=Saccharomyces cerevisiae (strain ATCC 204508 / S288c) GN=KRE6 PE=1 SV=2 [Rhizoctonia solani AG-1 IB]
MTHLTKAPLSTLGAYNLGGINASGQVPEILGFRGLIDKETPKSAYTRTSHVDGTTYDLVFSDEFNVDGRSFYPGDDPYWEAVDMHYWVTDNLEWYDPAQVKTIGGSLRIDLEERINHNMSYAGGMLSTWNKFCFTEGYIEANISLPGASNVYGLWPAFWLMGNLGRAGYGASVEGTWPYTYDTCDIGTLANQTDPVTNLPAAAHVGGPVGTNGEMSYLPGQRLSACTCSSESDGSDSRQMVHPGPKRADGSYVGRSAPEIDVFEAAVDTTTLIGHVSQSGQWAPFNAEFRWDIDENLVIYNHENSHLNTFTGNERQQTTSVVTNTNQQCYTASGGCFQTYGTEYKTGDDGYIQWVTESSPVFMIKAAGLGPDPAMQIGPRPVPLEPMVRHRDATDSALVLNVHQYILLNLGLSHSFGSVDFERLVFPAYMLVDYVRVYQPSGKWNIGCDPKDYPTADYINTSVHYDPCLLCLADQHT